MTSRNRRIRESLRKKKKKRERASGYQRNKTNKNTLGLRLIWYAVKSVLKVSDLKQILGKHVWRPPNTIREDQIIEKELPQSTL